MRSPPSNGIPRYPEEAGGGFFAIYSILSTGAGSTIAINPLL
jgi:hypothetical protein